MTSAKESQLAVPGIGLSFPLAKKHRAPSQVYPETESYVSGMLQ